MRKFLKFGCGAVVLVVAALVVIVALSPSPPSSNAPASTRAPATNTPVQQVAADDAAYFDAVARISGDMGASLPAFSALMANANVDDMNWTIDAATHLAIWTASYRDAQALTPPAAYRDMHALFVDALRLYDEAGGDIAKGVDVRDIGQVQAGAAKMTQAGEQLTRANAEMQRVQGTVD